MTCYIWRHGILRLTSRPFPTEKISSPKKTPNVSDVIISVPSSKEFLDSKIEIARRFGVRFDTLGVQLKCLVRDTISRFVILKLI